MKELDRSNFISLVGEIISVYENQGKRFVKIRYDQGYVDLSLKEAQDIYLGDKVTVDSDLTIKKKNLEKKNNLKNNSYVGIQGGGLCICIIIII